MLKDPPMQSERPQMQIEPKRNNAVRRVWNGVDMLGVSFHADIMEITIYICKYDRAD